MEQLFTNRKFHFCYHRNLRFFFVGISAVGISVVAVGDSRETDKNIVKGEYKLVFGSAEMWLRKTWINNFKKSALRFSGNFWILKTCLRADY